MKKLNLYAVVVFIFVAVNAEDDDPYRLPPNYIVNHYDIDLVVPAESLTDDSSNYSGSVLIEFQVCIVFF